MFAVPANASGAPLSARTVAGAAVSGPPGTLGLLKSRTIDQMPDSAAPDSDAPERRPLGHDSVSSSSGRSCKLVPGYLKMLRASGRNATTWVRTVSLVIGFSVHNHRSAEPALVSLLAGLIEACPTPHLRRPERRMRRPARRQGVDTSACLRELDGVDAHCARGLPAGCLRDG